MWEYKVITWIGGNLEVLLNEMGSQGWDLCGIREDDFIFKRSKDTNTDTNPYYPYYPSYPSYPYYPVTPYYTNPPYTVTSGTSGTITASPANTTSTTI